MPAQHSFTSDQKNFIRDYVKHLLDGNAALFAGAGLSIDSGLVDWRGLLAEIAEDLGLKIDQETDLILVAQFHETKTGGRSKLNARIIEEFTEKATLTDNHRVLARLPISTFWTTNYDKLLEIALDQAGKRVEVKHEVAQLSNTKPRRQAIVYKMHGDADHPNDATLTKDDYERYHRDKEGFVNALGADLISKNFLFIGFSFTDPNIDYILSRVRLFLKGNTRQHFCVIKRVSRQGKSQKAKAEYEYQTRRQQLMIGELNRFHITAVIVDEYKDIPLLLAEIERRYKRRTVFISGSAAQYSPYKEFESLEFIHRMSHDLVKDKYTVVSGFGLGVGSAVINGALEAIEQTPDQCSDDQLVLRPFPQVATGGIDLNERWQRYRTRMLSTAGIAVFVFGNKLKSNPEDSQTLLIENAGGIRKEFEIAKQQGLAILPVGATGSIAQELWQEVANDYASYFPSSTPQLKSLFMSLGDTSRSLSQHRSTILEILKKLNQFS